MNEPNEPKRAPRSRPGAEHRGELFWRGVRYLAAVFAGYLLGIAAGRLGGESPGWPLIVLVAAVALFLVFRQGRKSVSHAAADAVAAARAEANAAAQAVNRNEITVAGGHVVQGPADGFAAAPAVRVLDAERGVVQLPDGRVCTWPGAVAAPEVVELSGRSEVWDGEVWS